MSLKSKYWNRLFRKLRRPGNGKPSGMMSGERHVSYLHQQQPDIQSKHSLHRTIRTLPYENFVLVLTEGELAPLIISGEPPIDELVLAWQNITEEYSDAIRVGKSKNVFDCLKKIERTRTHIKIIESAAQYLQQRAEFVKEHLPWETNIYHDPEVASSVSELGYTLIKPAESFEEYLTQIERVRTEARTLVVLLQQYENEFRILSPDSEAVKRDYQSYMRELVMLSRFQGYPLKAKEITVSDYCNIINAFIEYHDALKKTNQK